MMMKLFTRSSIVNRVLSDSNEPQMVFEVHLYHFFSILSIHYYIEDRTPHKLSDSKYKYFLYVKIFGKDIFKLSGRMKYFPHQYSDYEEMVNSKCISQ